MSTLFQVVGTSLVGPGISFDVAPLVDLSPQADTVEGRKSVLVDIANVVYREGRATAMLSWDDRYDLRSAVETLRGLAVVVGSDTGVRHRRAADILARLLDEQG